MFYHKKLHEDCEEFQEHTFLKSWDMRCFLNRRMNTVKNYTVQLVLVLILRTAPRSFLKENLNILYFSEL